MATGSPPFDAVLAGMIEYIRSLQNPSSDTSISIAVEILSRIRQLSWLYQNVTHLEGRVLARHAALYGKTPESDSLIVLFSLHDPTNAVQTPITMPEQLSAFGEAFYNCAYRLITLVDECQSSLPKLRPIKATGIRRVRNNLLVHANKKGGTEVNTFSVSNRSGLRLRPASLVDEEPYLDEGLAANAMELLQQLNATLIAANAA